MQLTFEGKTIDQLAIELIQAWEPVGGYYLGFSGGKDSVVIYDLAKRAGVKFQAHYSVSPIDPPQIHQFIKDNYPDVVRDFLAKGFWGKPFMNHGLPLRRQRWCCGFIKETGGDTFPIKILGMRRAESNHRKNYNCFMAENKKHNAWLLPIVNWSDMDVWQYISENGIRTCSLYREGFKRIGCVLCPFASKNEIALSLQKFPKIVNLWRLAADRYITMRNTTPNHTPSIFKTGEEYFNWWIKRG